MKERKKETTNTKEKRKKKERMNTKEKETRT